MLTATARNTVLHDGAKENTQHICFILLAWHAKMLFPLSLILFMTVFGFYKSLKLV